jgi:hypothetical protein
MFPPHTRKDPTITDNSSSQTNPFDTFQFFPIFSRGTIHWNLEVTQIDNLGKIGSNMDTKEHVSQNLALIKKKKGLISYTISNHAWARIAPNTRTYRHYSSTQRLSMIHKTCKQRSKREGNSSALC